MSSRDGRIGWLSEASRSYMEFSLDGKVVRHVDTSELHKQGNVQRVVHGVALCDSGDLFVSAHWLEADNTKKWGIFVRDEPRDSWKLNMRSGNWGMLYGCDGNLLAGRTAQRSIT